MTAARVVVSATELPSAQPSFPFLNAGWLLIIQAKNDGAVKFSYVERGERDQVVGQHASEKHTVRELEYGSSGIDNKRKKITS
jgi:hypothetical protein